MHFAFAIVNLFPGGGLQRDCVDIARRVRKLGHDVTIFTSRKTGDGFADDLPVRILGVTGHTNHRRQRTFSDAFTRAASGQFDLLVGFDKLGGLDVLYCSDRSMRARAAKNPLLRLLPRYREYISLESECFAPEQATEILLLSESQLNEYWSAWRTEPKRLVMLPPTLVPARRKPEYRTNGMRAQSRARLGLRPGDWVWIAACVQPNTKGTDRSVRALRQFPDARLLIVGLHEAELRSAKTRRIAHRLGVAQQIKWLGHREDVPELMAAADVFVHPARYDTTGTVILEAIVNGLPVITTSSCGYAKHVNSANAGIVVQEPFRSQTLVAALEIAHDPACIERWSSSGSEYGQQSSLYEGRGRATELIVASALRRGQAAVEGRRVLREISIAPAPAIIRVGAR
jgi:UDP-glucose:(heptosyl)LPS alpha-1,3-glucosyltransferase